MGTVVKGLGMSPDGAQPHGDAQVLGDGVVVRSVVVVVPEPGGASVRHAFEVVSPGPAGGARLELRGDVDRELTLVAIVHGDRVRLAEWSFSEGDLWTALLPPLDLPDASVVILVLDFVDREATESFWRRWAAKADMAPPPPPWDDGRGAGTDDGLQDAGQPFDDALGDLAGGGFGMGAPGPQFDRAPKPDMKMDPGPPPGADVPGAPAPVAPPGADVPAPPKTATRAHIDAEMPKHLVEHEPFVLTVRLSRKRLVATAGTARAKAVIPIDPDRPVDVTIATRGIARAPRTRATRRMRLPVGATDIAVVTFPLIPVDVGVAEVSVLVRQDPVALPLATMRVRARIHAAGTRIPSKPVRVPAQVSGRPADIVRLPTLSVDESIAGGISSLRITATIDGESASHTERIGDKARFVDFLYNRLRAIRDHVQGIVDPALRPAAARGLLTEEGRALAGRLFGADVGALLWKHKDDLDGLIVQTSGELDLPWEIVALAPPAPADDDGLSHFLAEAGLVRWVHDTARPEEIVIRPDHAISIAPEYTENGLQLDRTIDEIRVLRSRLGIEPLAASSAQDISAVVSTDFDLLHFAGHGRWKTDDPRGQQLLLALFDDARPDPSASYLDADVRRDLPDRAIRNPDTRGPLVFLSACDVGRLQSGKAGLGGFAEAFLRGGAGAFIGCSWAVRDDVASTFVSVFYEAFLDEEATVATATKRARTAASKADDLTFLAFTVFANPKAHRVPA